MIELTFLEADQPLRKSYALDSKGLLTKQSYPNVWEFTSHVERVEDITSFAAALTRHAALGHCLLKGSCGRKLLAESRAGSTDPAQPTSYVCLDIDRAGRVGTVEEALTALGLADLSYCVQYSASYGVEQDKGLTAHAFILLAQPLSPSALKQWLIHLNLETPWLRHLLSLTKTNNAISWPLDISTCQNDKLLYIAAPQLGEGVQSGFEGERIQIVQKGLPALDVSRLVIPSAEQNRTATNAALDQLRAGAGLPKRTWRMGIDKASGMEVLARPDASTLTGVKNERGFTYFNLNGGDSWGYYHSAEAPEVIRNFKGEPNYLTSELLPEYWEQVLQARKKARYAAIESKRSEDIEILAFRDFKSAAYYNGTFAPATNTLELARATSETQLQHFLVEHGRPALESIPIWDIFYDPRPLRGLRVDVANQRVNLFAPSAFMEGAGGNIWKGGETLSRRCPSFARVLASAVGRDEGLIDHWLNWLACIVKYRVRTRLAWMLFGVEGTGKGVLLNFVLKPLLGASNVTMKRMAELEDNFNGYIENSLLVIIDEAQVSGSRKADMIMANLKHQITEPEVSIRKMYTASYLAPNYCNFMFYSNKADPVEISLTDRRFCCGEYGPTNLNPSPEFLEALTAELPSIAAYLDWRPADLVKAGTVYESVHRDLVRATGLNSIETTAQALTSGNIEFFWDSLPAGNGGILGADAQALYDAYTQLVHGALRAENGVQKLTRDEVRVLFAYNVGDVPRTPTKFTSMLRHHRISLTPQRINGRVVRGVEVNWKAGSNWTQARLAELGEKTPLLRRVA